MTTTTANNNTAQDIEDIKAAVNEWNNGLDSGDLDRVIATCDPDAVTCNQGVQTVVGTQGIRDKFAPRIAAATIKSGFDYEHIKVYGDVAVVVGYFSGEMTDKASGDVRTSGGRLVIVYRRVEDGSWKMVLDMDNTDPNLEALYGGEEGARTCG